MNSPMSSGSNQRQDTNFSGSSAHSKSSLHPPSADQALVFKLQSSEFENVRRSEIFNEKNILRKCLGSGPRRSHALLTSVGDGYQEAKIPLGRRTVKVVLKGASRHEINVDYGKVRLPDYVRRKRLFGQCKTMYISTMS